MHTHFILILELTSDNSRVKKKGSAPTPLNKVIIKEIHTTYNIITGTLR